MKSSGHMNQQRATMLGKHDWTVRDIPIYSSEGISRWSCRLLGHCAPTGLCCGLEHNGTDRNTHKKSDVYIPNAS